MPEYKICLGVNDQFGLPYNEQIKLFKEIGFDAFFTHYCEEISEYRALADKLGLIYQSVHAPFMCAAKMWNDDDEAVSAVNELLDCVKKCSENNIPILVVHPFIGFGMPYTPTKAGLDNFRLVVNAAKTFGVKIAFENVEGQPFLEALMTEFESYDNVGFCWDTGHELCYNKGTDMLSFFGNRLIATHFNDNLGVSGETIYWTDDLHLLPFDGITNWQSVAGRIKKHGYNGILTFELNTQSKPDRHENDEYAAMPIKDYIAEAYARACKLRALLEE